MSQLSGFPTAIAPAARWRDLADRKTAQIDEWMARAARMKGLLESSFRCRCPTLDDCARAIAQAERS